MKTKQAVYSVKTYQPGPYNRGSETFVTKRNHLELEAYLKTIPPGVKVTVFVREPRTWKKYRCTHHVRKIKEYIQGE